MLLFAVPARGCGASGESYEAMELGARTPKAKRLLFILIFAYQTNLAGNYSTARPTSI
jgi:hypothetical protein